MSFTLLFNLVKELFSDDNLIELTDIYDRFYKSDGDLVWNINYEFNKWLDELCDLWDIPDGIFRKAWKLDMLSDYDQIKELINDVKLYKEQLEDDKIESE